MSTDELSARVHELDWYHTIHLPGGVTTPGLFNHNPVIDRYELPDDLSGKRVLDVGTFDGYFAFELERRGAAEVVAIDLGDRDELDWPVPTKESGTARFRPRRSNFDIAHGALGSKVDYRVCSAYDASPERLGTFDLVFVGSLLIHLRDPVRALTALRSVCRGDIHLGEHVSSRTHPNRSRRSTARFEATNPYLTWWVPNRRCLGDWLTVAGYKDVRHGGTFTVPFQWRRGGILHAVVGATA